MSWTGYLPAGTGTDASPATAAAFQPVLMRAGRPRAQGGILWLVGAVLLFMALTHGARGEVRASVENGFETSGPLEAGFLRVRLENTGNTTRHVTVSLPAVLMEHQVELPPTSRKELPLIVMDGGPLVIRDQGRELLRQEISFPVFDTTILVISERETGLRVLSRDPVQPFAQTAKVYQRSGTSVVMTAPPSTRSVRVFRTRPQDLPSSVWGYHFPGQPRLIIAHPGGYDAMTPAQREALTYAATHLIDTVLVSEGRADAFAGTPLEGLVPGKAVSVRSYDEWPAHFPGSTAVPAAMTVFQPDEDTVTSHTTMEGQPLVVQANRHGRFVTYLAFDYSAPPLRSWNSRAFWDAVLDARSREHDIAISVCSSEIQNWELLHLAQTPPAPLRLGLAVAVLGMGYALAVFASRRQQNEPLAWRSWLTGPVWLTAGFLVAVAIGSAIQGRTGGISDISVVVPTDNRSIGRRSGFVALQGPGTIHSLAAQTSHAVLLIKPNMTPLYHRLRLASQAPPVISEAILKQTGLIPLHTGQYVHVGGPVEMAATRLASGINDFQLRVTNRSSLKLRDVLLFLGGEFASLKDVEPGGEMTTEVKLRPAPSPTRALFNGALPSATLSREDAVIEIGTRVSRPYSLGIHNSGFAVARIDLPPHFPGTTETLAYLIVPVIVK